jgi:hypothetical protein
METYYGSADFPMICVNVYNSYYAFGAVIDLSCFIIGQYLSFLIEHYYYIIYYPYII